MTWIRLHVYVGLQPFLCLFRFLAKSTGQRIPILSLDLLSAASEPGKIAGEQPKGVVRAHGPGWLVHAGFPRIPASRAGSGCLYTPHRTLPLE